jgi:hypothetical protein
MNIDLSALKIMKNISINNYFAGNMKKSILILIFHYEYHLVF